MEFQPSDNYQARGGKEADKAPVSESKLTRFLKWYNRVPLLRKVPPSSLFSFIVVVSMTALLRLFFPPGECTCEDQFIDPKLEAMADSGNQEVKQYMAQKDNPINCAGRRKELLEQLQRKKNKNRSTQ